VLKLTFMHDMRIRKIREELEKKYIDALLVSNFYSILYLTGFKTLTTDEREAFVIVAKEKVYLFSDARYIDEQLTLNTQYSTFEYKLIEPNKSLISHLYDIVEEEKINSLGFEAEDLKYSEYQKLSRTFKKLNPVSTDRLTIKIRELKDKQETDCIARACEIGDRCLTEIVKIIRPGVSEKEIGFKIEMWIREKGCDLAFDPIVAIDANASVVHYNTKDGDGVVKDGSIVLIDFGVKYKNYLSDMTRMVFVGQPNDEVKKTYEILAEAQQKTVEKITELETLKEADEFCRKLITDNRLPSYPHSTGHGVGLEIHEYPKVSLNSPDKRKVNQVFTIEPGVYFPDKHGMRVEDTVVIKEDGKARILTKFPKSLLAI